MLPTEVIHDPPTGVHRMWVDEWWGPGGHLVVTAIDPETEPLYERRYDAHEVLTRPNGTQISYKLFEGAKYHTLEELFGPELWTEYQAQTHVP